MITWTLLILRISGFPIEKLEIASEREKPPTGKSCGNMGDNRPHKLNLRIRKLVTETMRQKSLLADNFRNMSHCPRCAQSNGTSAKPRVCGPDLPGWFPIARFSGFRFKHSSHGSQ